MKIQKDFAKKIFKILFERIENDDVLDWLQNPYFFNNIRKLERFLNNQEFEVFCTKILLKKIIVGQLENYQELLPQSFHYPFNKEQIKSVSKFIYEEIWDEFTEIENQIFIENYKLEEITDQDWEHEKNAFQNFNFFD